MAEIAEKWWVTSTGQYFVASTSCFVSYSVLHQIPLFPMVIKKNFLISPAYMGPSSLNLPDHIVLYLPGGPSPQEMVNDRCIT